MKKVYKFFLAISTIMLVTRISFANDASFKSSKENKKIFITSINGSSDLEWLNIDADILNEDDISFQLYSGFYQLKNEFDQKTIPYIEGQYSKLYLPYKKNSQTHYSSFNKFGIRYEDDNLLKVVATHGFLNNDFDRILSETVFSTRYIHQYFDKQSIREYGLGFKKSYFLSMPILKLINVEGNYFKCPKGRTTVKIDDNTDMVIDGYCALNVNTGANLHYEITENLHLIGKLYAGFGRVKKESDNMEDLVFGYDLNIATKLGVLGTSFKHSPKLNYQRYSYTVSNKKVSLTAYNQFSTNLGTDFTQEKLGVGVSVNFINLADIFDRSFFKCTVGNAPGLIEGYSRAAYTNHCLSDNNLAANPVSIVRKDSSVNIQNNSKFPINQHVDLKNGKLVVTSKETISCLAHYFPYQLISAIELEDNKISFDLLKIKDGDVGCMFKLDKGNKTIKLTFNVETRGGVKHAKSIQIEQVNSTDQSGDEIDLSENSQINLKVKNFKLNSDYDSGRNKCDNKTNIKTLMFTWDHLKKADQYLIEIKNNKATKNKLVSTKNLKDNAWTLIDMPDCDGCYEVSIIPMRKGKQGEKTSINVGYFTQFAIDYNNKKFEYDGSNVRVNDSDDYWGGHYSVSIPIITLDDSVNIYNIDKSNFKCQLKSPLFGSQIDTNKLGRAINAEIESVSFDGKNINITFITTYSIFFRDNWSKLLDLAHSFKDASAFDFIVDIYSLSPLEDSVGNMINQFYDSYHVINPFFSGLDLSNKHERN